MLIVVVNIYVAFKFIVVNCQMWLLNVSQCKKLSLCRYVMQSFFSSQKDESNRRCRSRKLNHLDVKIISSFRNRRVKLRAFYSKLQKCAKIVQICYHLDIYFKLNTPLLPKCVSFNFTHLIKDDLPSVHQDLDPVSGVQMKRFHMKLVKPQPRRRSPSHSRA